uniref:Apple domain-containing protein n=1 Tax=Magallana gigas TaxID=29159 RepID=K1PTG3_MAGGI
MAIWSGHFPRRSYCAAKCTQEPDCVSLLYNMANGSCDLFNVIYDNDDRGDVDYYWVLEDRGSRWDDIFLRRTTTRVDVIEPNMAIWSGHFPRRSYCAAKCTQEPDCVSLLYNMANGSCDLFNVIYDNDDRGDVDYYWVLEDRGSRWGKL